MDDEVERDTGGERERRIEALRALAGQRSASELSAPAAQPARVETVARPRAAGRRRGLWLSLAAAVVVVAGVIAAAIAVWPRHPASPPRPIPDPLALALSVSLECPVSSPVAWSPDGTHVAVVGYSDCGGPVGITGPSSGPQQTAPSTGGTLVVYDAMKGRSLQSVPLDTFVASVAVPQSVRGDASAMSQVQLAYDGLIWSPDGRELALRYNASRSYLNGAVTASDTYGSGLLLVQWSSHALRALPAPAQSAPIQWPESSFQPAPVIRWDLTAGTGTLEYLPPAQSYAWSTGGTLAPTSSLPTSPDATPQPASAGPVGNPDGGPSFTMWQSGYAQYNAHCSTPQPGSTVPPACCPITSYYAVGYGASAAWSPDGRYLVQSFGIGLGAFGKTPQTLAPAASPLPVGCSDPKLSATLAPLPVRDRALAAILETLPPPRMINGSLQGSGQVQVMWSADGRYLVTQGGPGNAVLSVYDCATGQVIGKIGAAPFIAQIPFNKRDKGSSVYINTSLWSPRGQRLLAVDTTDGVMLILGPKSLGL